MKNDPQSARIGHREYLFGTESRREFFVKRSDIIAAPQGEHHKY
jgi:hypothetical protein